MFDGNFKELAASLVHTARSAGELILRYRGQNADVTFKDDGSPLTAADQVAEEMIINDLARIAPGIVVIGEESSAVLPEEFNPDEPFFLVDPLDGTREFVRGGKEFTVNIALIRDRQPVFGLIYAPELQVLYVTLSPQEAVCARLAPERGDGLDTLSTHPLRTAEPSADRLKVLVSRSHRNAETDNYLTSLPEHETVTLGSSLKFGVLADGAADVYPRLGPTCEWDTAAGHALLNAAGGVLLTIDGQPFTYGKRAENLVNPGFVALGKPATATRLGLAKV
jgi:3'(2'), 5'-bisphosphate nucleotidase